MYPRFHRLIAVGLMVAVLIVVSCSTPPASPPTSGTSATATKPYGSLTIAVDFGTGHLDPTRDIATGYYNFGSAVIDNLVYRDATTNEEKPGIAERWEISPDGLTHTFYIRRGVKFHDGSDLTGADVKFSLERMMSSTTTYTMGRTWRRAVASVELKDDYTVALHLNTPRFLPLPEYNHGVTAVMPKKYIEEKGEDYFASHVVGSGPWKAVKFEPGSRLELEADENYWDTTRIPKFKNITLLNVSQEATKVAMLKTGELDMAVVSFDSVPGLEAAGLRILSRAPGAAYFAPLLFDKDNPEQYTFGDVRVRKAMQLAINGREMANSLFGGRAEPVSMATALVDSQARANAYDPNLLKPDPYDPEGAKRLLAEAGYPNGFDTRIHDVGGGDLRSLLVAALAGYWRKIGVNAETVAIDYGAWMTLYQARSPKTWNSAYLFVYPGERSWEKLSWFYSKGSSGARNYKNPRVDQLWENIPTTRDPVERERMALEAAVLARNGYAFMAVLDTHTNLALSQKIGDVAHARYIAQISGRMFETITHAK